MLRRTKVLIELAEELRTINSNLADLNYKLDQHMQKIENLCTSIDNNQRHYNPQIVNGLSSICQNAYLGVIEDREIKDLLNILKGENNDAEGNSVPYEAEAGS